MEETNGVKPGNLTSEKKMTWWAIALAAVIGAVPAVLELLDKGSTAYVVLAAVLAVATALSGSVYTVGRSMVKAAASKAEGMKAIANGRAKNPQ